MKIAIMQPYFFPYIGYFELMARVDLFVFLEDVQFTKRGWINRNRIRSEHHDFQYLTVPVTRCSRSAKINEVLCCSGWKELVTCKIIKTYGNNLHPSIIEALPPAETARLVDLLKHSLVHLCRELKIKCQFASSDGISRRAGQDKIVDICRFFGATEYWNLPGGACLYQQEAFEQVKLNFMQLTSFENRLSIIDAMSKSVAAVTERIREETRKG